MLDKPGRQLVGGALFSTIGVLRVRFSSATFVAA
jgi:hypothetical protein